MRHACGAAGVCVVVLALSFAASVHGQSTLTQPEITFVRGTAGAPQTVWIASSNGLHARELGRGARPLISPDGRTVAASSTSTGGRALTLYATSRGAPHTFFDARMVTAMPASWSADSRFLAVVLASTNPVSSAASGLAVIDTHGFVARLIAGGPIEGASFAPDSSDRIVYASAASLSLSAAVNLFTSASDGTARQRLTSDGRSLYPVWGSHGIAFDRERLRHGEAPAYQVWILSGTRRSRLTNVHVPPLLNGLVPVAFSDSGARLLAEYTGLDTDRAWTIQVAPRRAHQIRFGHRLVSPGAISHDGTSLLVDAGGYPGAPPNSGVVESVSFEGTGARALVRGAQPAWNR